MRVGVFTPVPAIARGICSSVFWSGGEAPAPLKDIPNDLFAHVRGDAGCHVCDKLGVRMPALNLRSPDLAAAYNAVLSGDPNMNWALFSDSENDLKVSATGGGGLEELQEEFSDGRIQYAFVRVVDPNVRNHRSRHARPRN